MVGQPRGVNWGPSDSARLEQFLGCEKAVARATGRAFPNTTGIWTGHGALIDSV
jgi:hypothetical protein